MEWVWVLDILTMAAVLWLVTTWVIMMPCGIIITVFHLTMVIIHIMVFLLITDTEVATTEADITAAVTTEVAAGIIHLKYFIRIHIMAKEVVAQEEVQSL